MSIINHSNIYIRYDGERKFGDRPPRRFNKEEGGDGEGRVDRLVENKCLYKLFACNMVCGCNCKCRVVYLNLICKMHYNC